MNPKYRKGLRTWIEIDKKALAGNFKVFRKFISPKVKICAVVKSNAYGHGLVDFSKHASDAGVDWLAVDSVVEGLRLRKEGIEKPILVLGYTLSEMVEKASDNNLSITISHFEGLNSLKKLPKEKQIKVHLKIDTGMHRQGFLNISDAGKIISFLKKNKNVILEGIYTHFAQAKDPKSKKETLKQLAVFKEWIEIFNKNGFQPIVHSCATGGLFNFPEAHFDMVRIGAGLYGIWPSEETRKYFESKLKLEQILSWKTIISEIKKLPKGSAIGYNFSEKLNRDSVVAICPIGYWHGLPRQLSSVGQVLIKGKRAKVLGKVAMDMIALEVTGIKAKIGDEVVIIGKSSKEEVCAEDLAELSGTTAYEILTRINPLIKKIYI